MPTLSPTVAVLTATPANVQGIQAALFNYFNGTPVHFDLVANGGDVDAYTITPKLVSETWHLNLRRPNTTQIIQSIDPLGGITDPGGTGGPPTLADNTEWSGEITNFTPGAINSTFYLIELPDAIFVIPVDAGTSSFNPQIIHSGKIFIPDYYDGIRGEGYIDGLGVGGGIPMITNSAGASDFMSSNGLTVGRMAQSFESSQGDHWYTVAEYDGAVGNAQSSRIRLRERFARFPTEAQDVETNNDAVFGLTKYVLGARVNQNPGALMDGGPGNDAWVYLHDSDTANNFLAPWDRDITPIF